MISKQTVRKFISLNLNPVPVKKGSKEPLRKRHTEPIQDEEVDRLSFEEIGVSTGYASLNLEALDFDLKNTDDPKEFMERFNKMIPTALYNKLVIQTTPSGGFHYIYRCSKIESNRKLARNKKGAATIETRGIGGYIKCSPSEGYKCISDRRFSDITYIEEDERLQLFIIAKQFDELHKKDVIQRFSKEDLLSFKKFEEYNSDSEIGIELLTEAGWTHHSTNGEWYNMTRPNSESGDLHGGYNTEGLFFQAFSTAQDTFLERKGYNNHHIFAELKCEGNYKKAYALLFEQGYGKELDELEEDEEDISFLSSFRSENEYLEQARKGEIELGSSWGWSELDRFIRLKKNSFNFILGVDNIGKSTLLSSVQVASNILHGMKWGISSPEATVFVTRRNLIEAEAGVSIDRLSRDDYNKLLERSRNNFHIINNDKHLTIDDVLRRGKILYERYGIDFLLIDPFSFYSGSGNFSEDTQVLSKIRVFCQNYCSVIVVDHPYTGFTRVAKDELGYIKIPTKYDASGGNIKANRCDDFISIHRIINHPDSDVRRTMQVSVQKVKDKSTGGEPHIEGDYTSLIYETRKGFTGYWDVNGDNPMYKNKMSKLEVNTQLKNITAEEAFG